MIGEQYGPNTLFISSAALNNVWYVFQEEEYKACSKNFHG